MLDIYLPKTKFKAENVDDYSRWLLLAKPMPMIPDPASTEEKPLPNIPQYTVREWAGILQKRAISKYIQNGYEIELKKLGNTFDPSGIETED